MLYFVLCTSSCSPSRGHTHTHTHTPFYSDFKVVALNLSRFAQVFAMQPWFRYPDWSYPQPLIIGSNMLRGEAQPPKGNLTSSPRYSKIVHWKARVGIVRHWKQNEGMQRDGRCMWMLAACTAWKAWNSIQSSISYWVDGLRPAILLAAPWEILQVAHIIPTWPIERQGLASDGVGSMQAKSRNAKGMQRPAVLYL